LEEPGLYVLHYLLDLVIMANGESLKGKLKPSDRLQGIHFAWADIIFFQSI